MVRRRSCTRAATVGTAVVLGAVALTGCSSLNPGTDDAAKTAQEFHSAVAAGDGETACNLLAPSAVEELEDGAPGACSDKLLELVIPGASQVTDSKAYGSNAQVLMDQDTVFLTRSGDTWKVTAAGCTQQGESPYDCEVGGS
ncbi:hypothetical protein [Arthrobacter crystallopoietes]|uniref:hypothetical protein n=1 Tax=Crystallibacter crystallopoietes TaxID=37928 RepID=UPI0011112999|nr:hypothetical protein [Arthrobacter crystallopoietes]